MSLSSQLLPLHSYHLYGSITKTVWGDLFVNRANDQEERDKEKSVDKLESSGHFYCHHIFTTKQTFRE